MSLLIVGLILFLGIHALNIVSPRQRAALIDRMGQKAWKLLFSVVSAVGLLLIVQGYATARIEPVWVWMPPTGLRHLVLLLTIPAFILFVAAYIPGNRIKAKLGHPMLVGVKIWAFSHLLANGSLADIMLFGSFLIWAIAGFAVLRRRDRLYGKTSPAGTLQADIISIATGLVAWAFFAMVLHTLLIGVSPLPFVTDQ